MWDRCSKTSFSRIFSSWEMSLAVISFFSKSAISCCLRVGIIRTARLNPDITRQYADYSTIALT